MADVVNVNDLIFGVFNTDYDTMEVKLVAQTDMEDDVDGDEMLIQTLSQIEATEEPIEEPKAAVETKLPEPKLAKAGRYPEMSEADIDDLLTSKDASNTVKMTVWAVKQFKQWLAMRGFPEDFEAIPVDEFDRILRRYYGEVRTADGKMYSRSTYGGIRAAINRHVRAPPHNRTINLMSTEFHHSNQVFKATLKKLCTDGLDQSTHHQPISMADLKKLRQSSSMNISNQHTLQRKVWFDLTIHFARRGCENINSLKKDAYSFKTDDVGREYVEMNYNEKLKNHHGFDNTENLDAKPRMYASTQGSTECPVESLRLYMSKLNPTNPLLFQQPRQKVDETDTIWYTSRPVGAKKISGFMAKLSEDAGLSRRYTNHCVRATTITMLSHAGVSNRAITRITKHRNEGSLKHYEQDSSENQKRNFADILLQENVNSKNVPTPQAPISTIDSQVENASTSSANLPANMQVSLSQYQRQPARYSNIPPSATMTNMMSNQQYMLPQYQNPYNFSGCEVSVQNHYHYH